MNVLEIETDQERASRIVDLVCFHCYIAREDMLGKRRTATLSKSRHVTMLLIRKFTELSFVEIAEIFKRSHGSIIKATQLIDKASGQTRRNIEAFSEEIKSWSPQR